MGLPRSGTSTGRRRTRVGLAVVRGRSMLPTLRPGDRLLVTYPGRPRVGRLAVVELPDGTVAVKRLQLDDGGWWVGRDNPHEGVDSWTAGKPVRRVLGVVEARVWPRPSPLRGRPPGG